MDITRSTALGHTFKRLERKNLEISGFLNIGSGRADDLGFFKNHFPDMHSLFIDMDDRFLPGWKKLARKYPNTQYVVCGASSEDGAGQFTKSNDVGGALISGDSEKENMKSVPLRKLDTLVKEFELPGPYFLKFDTHGVELDILEGAKEVLKNTHLIMMEVYNFKLNFVNQRNLTFDEMSLHMKTLGFRCVDICETLFRPADYALWQFHMIFIRDDHPCWQRNSYSA